MRTTLLFGLSFTLALGVASREARAQSSVTGIVGAVKRCEPGPVDCASADSATGNPHPAGVALNALNFEDCDANLSYQFPIGISSPSSSYTLQAWAGTQDCSVLANRQTSATAVCWPVAPAQAALISPFLLDVRAQDIVSGVHTTTHPVGYAPTSDPAVCQSTQTGPTNVTLYLFFVDAEANPVGTVQQYPVTVDTRAGDVQGAISAYPGSGGDSLLLDVPPTTDPDTQSYNVYCDEGSTAPDAGVLGDSGAAVPSPGTCGASILQGLGASADGGAMTEALQYGQSLSTKYLCGTVPATENTIGVTGLQQGHYNVAVAAVDALGNVGPLSNVACGAAQASSGAGTGTPASGRACAAAAAGAPAGAGGFGVTFVAAMAALVRKRKRSARS